MQAVTIDGSKNHFVHPTWKCNEKSSRGETSIIITIITTTATTKITAVRARKIGKRANIKKRNDDTHKQINIISSGSEKKTHFLLRNI